MKETGICGLNLKSEVIDNLKEKEVNIYDGNIGFPTRLKYQESFVRCLPQLNYPGNFHEFQVLILDLTNDNETDYHKTDHTINNSKTDKESYLICFHPQQIYDSRALSLSILKEKIEENLQQGFLLIVFCSKDEETSYTIEGQSHSSYKQNLYSFLSDIPYHSNRSGLKTTIPNNKGEIFTFLKKYNDQFKYEIVFELPENSNNQLPTSEFTPLVLTSDNKVAGFYNLKDNSASFFFPKIENKSDFLEDFLKEIAPNYLPDLFPDIVKNDWIKDKRYQLPNEQRLVLEKEKLEKDYKDAHLAKLKEIKKNREVYSFLTDILTKTDDELVIAVIQFLKWLGFNNAKNADSETTKSFKEEDIQIETSTGLIVIEVKGLGGTSKDSECAQIGKIRNRRQREMKDFNIFAHYIVNHQRHKPADKRVNPPFSTEQILDANYDERGLITTWQLFNLYFAVNDGIISKEEAMSCFYQSGLIEFIPNTMIKLGTPNEFFVKNTVIIVHLEGNIKLRTSDRLLYKEGNVFKIVTIESIKIDEKLVSSASEGEVGLKLNHPINKDVVLYAYPMKD